MYKVYLGLSVIFYGLTVVSPFYLVAGSAFAALAAIQHYADLRPLDKRLKELEERLARVDERFVNLSSTVSFMRNGGSPKK